MSELERTLFAITESLSQFGYDYVVMGGLAVRVHSIPRPTYDVDLTISIGRSELPKLFESLENLGHTIAESYRQGWVDEGYLLHWANKLDITDRLEKVLRESQSE
jgi:hypothetical protein